jgi:mono/diheme cytochrome c family protein
MGKYWILKSGLFVSAAVLAVWAGTGAALAATDKGQRHDDVVARGKYLASAGDCMACHTVPGGAPYAGGRYIDTPFGAIASPNITPDRTTGIGGWTDEQFYRAMHEGIGRHGEYLYPVMPFPWYSLVTKEDVAAIKAYLFSLAPVQQPEQPSRLHFPFNLRPALLAWRTVFFKPAVFTPDAAQPAEVNRGAYLVNGLGHCGECHNAHPVAGTSAVRKPLQGSEIDQWYAPNITSDVRDGIGGWSNDDIVAFLKTGVSPRQGVALGPMAETVHSLSALSEADLQAIAAYLKSTPPTEGPSRQALGDQGYRGPGAKGGGTYLSYCASCHGVDGRGVAGVVPALAGNGAVRSKGPQNVIEVVLGGLPARRGYGQMPAVGAALSDAEVADVVNYVRQLGGNAASVMAETDGVAALRASTHTALNPGLGPAAGQSAPCPTVSPAAVSKALADPRTGLADQLAGVNDNDLYPQTQRLVAMLRAAAPGLAQADMINGLTSAYCPVARQAHPDPAELSVRLGTFGQLVYTQLQTGRQARHQAHLPAQASRVSAGAR